MSMNELPDGVSARITNIGDSPMRHRLFELGAIPGSEVKKLFGSPCGCNGCYEICGALIGLRNEIAATIKVDLSDRSV